jgi:hypothetical protein
VQLRPLWCQHVDTSRGIAGLWSINLDMTNILKIIIQIKFSKLIYEMLRNFAKFRKIKILFCPLSYFAKIAKTLFHDHPRQEAKAYRVW